MSDHLTSRVRVVHNLTGFSIRSIPGKKRVIEQWFLGMNNFTKIFLLRLIRLPREKSVVFFSCLKKNKKEQFNSSINSKLALRSFYLPACFLNIPLPGKLLEKMQPTLSNCELS